MVCNTYYDIMYANSKICIKCAISNAHFTNPLLSHRASFCVITLAGCLCRGASPPPNPVAHRDLVLGLGPLAGPGGGFLWYLYGCYTLEAVEIKVRRGLQAEQLAAFGVIQATAGFADLNYPLLYTHNSFAVANIFKDHLPGKHPF